MLIDMHAHTSGISHCCKKDLFFILDSTKKVGLDGVVLTNHYTKRYLDNIEVEDFIEKYIEEYNACADYGRQIGCKVFFGIEVTMEFDTRIHLLIYGVSFDFLRSNPYLFDMDLETLYTLVHENGGILIQAHPFRHGTTILNTDYLDGLEINCHPKYGSTYSNEILAVAKEKELIVTSGADYHADVPYRPYCGNYFLDNYTSVEELVAFLRFRNGKLCVQELNEEEHYDCKVM